MDHEWGHEETKEGVDDMGFGTFISENKGAIIFAFLVMVIGSTFYITNGTTQMGAEETKTSVFQPIVFKVVEDADGTMHLLVNSKNNALAGFKTEQGNPIPEDNSIVLGSTEAERLKGLGKFSKTGENLYSYFGISTKIEGVLTKRGDIIDDLTFLSPREFEIVDGTEGSVFAKTLSDGAPKIFFYLGLNQTVPLKFKLSEGNMKGYGSHDLDGKTYYPIIIGATEAKSMRERKVFATTGDPIRDFFGKDFVVVGVLEETGTSMDRMYFVPLNETELTKEVS